MTNKIKNFITVGCSFTAGTSNIDLAKKNPTRWPHFLLSIIDPDFFANLAISGGGNSSQMTSLTCFLETKKNIIPTDTLIILNLTGLYRVDTMCSIDHPDANPHISWAQDLGFTWITCDMLGTKISAISKFLHKNMELEQIKTFSCLAIIQGLSYLESNNFNYFFMLMDDFILEDSPEWFRNFLEQRKNKWIKFDQHQTMHSYVSELELTCEDNFHPSTDGHKLIAQNIIDTLKLHTLERGPN